MKTHPRISVLSVLTACFSTVVSAALGDELAAFGYSINEAQRPLYKINPVRGSIDQTITTTFRPPGYGNDVADLGFAYGGGYVWALGYSVNNAQRPLYKIDPSSGALAQKITTPFRPPGYGSDVVTLSLAYGGGFLWALGYSVNDAPRPLYKINASSGAIAQTLTTPFRPPGYGSQDYASLGMAYGGGYLWALGYSVNGGQRPLYKIDPATGSIDQTVTTTFRPPGYGNDVADLGFAYGAGCLWALGYSVNDAQRPLYKINPSSGSVAQAITTTFRPPGYGTDIASLGLTYIGVAQISISANPPNGGSVAGGGSALFDTSVTVIASPSAGYSFMTWTEGGSVVSTSAAYPFTASASRTLVANFTPITYTIAVAASPAAGGTVGGGGTFAAGAARTVAATANPGYTFANWAENGTVVSLSAGYSFTLNANRNLVADFTAIAPPGVPPSIVSEPQNLTLAVGAPASFSVSVSGTSPLSYQWQYHGPGQPGGFFAAVDSITTVAGGGSSYPGDGGAATNAGVSPSGVAVDGFGNLFIAEAGNERVRKVGTNGIITTIAGNGYMHALPGPGGNAEYVGGYSGDGAAATNAELNSPSDIALDGFGNVFIADSLNYRIRKVATNGVITTVAGNGINGYSGDGRPATNASLYYPRYVAVDRAGNVFVADAYSCRIRKVGINGVITTVAGNGTNGYSGDGLAATSAELSSPAGIAVDALGNLFIADAGNERIRRVGTNGVITTVACNGTSGYAGGGGPATNAQFNAAIAVSVDGSGNLFITDEGNERIREVLTNGIIITVAGNGFMTKGISGIEIIAVGGYSGDGGAAIAAELNNPQGAAVGVAGDVFIADTRNGRVRKATPFLGPTLAFSSVQTNRGGDYRVIVTNAFGSVTSSLATLSVVSNPPVNLLGPGVVSGTPGGVGLGSNLRADSSRGSQLLISQAGSPSFGACRWLTDGRFQLEVYGQSGRNYVLQASANLVDWVPVATFVCTDTPTMVVDWESRNYGARFYKIAPR